MSNSTTETPSEAINVASSFINNTSLLDLAILALAIILIVVAIVFTVYLLWSQRNKKHQHSPRYAEIQEEKVLTARDYEREIKRLNQEIELLKQDTNLELRGKEIELRSKDAEIRDLKEEIKDLETRHANELANKDREISSLNTELNAEIQRAQEEQQKMRCGFENKINDLNRAHENEISAKEAEYQENLSRERENAEIQCQQYKEVVDKFFPVVPASIKEIFENWKLEIRQKPDGNASPIVLALLAQLSAWKAVAQSSDLLRQQDCLVLFSKILIEWCNQKGKDAEATYELVKKFAQAFNENLIPRSSFTGKIWLPAFGSPYKASRMTFSENGEDAGRIIGIESWGIISEEDECSVQATVVLG